MKLLYSFLFITTSLFSIDWSQIDETSTDSRYSLTYAEDCGASNYPEEQIYTKKLYSSSNSPTPNGNTCSIPEDSFYTYVSTNFDQIRVL